MAKGDVLDGLPDDDSSGINLFVLPLVVSFFIERGYRYQRRPVGLTSSFVSNHSDTNEGGSYSGSAAARAAITTTEDINGSGGGDLVSGRAIWKAIQRWSGFGGSPATTCATTKRLRRSMRHPPRHRQGAVRPQRRPSATPKSRSSAGASTRTIRFTAKHQFPQRTSAAPRRQEGQRSAPIVPSHTRRIVNERVRRCWSSTTVQMRGWEGTKEGVDAAVICGSGKRMAAARSFDLSSRQRACLKRIGEVGHFDVTNQKQTLCQF